MPESLFNKVAGLFSFEFCEISKNTFFHITPLMAASATSLTNIKNKHYSYKVSRPHQVVFSSYKPY